jgi:hypothetical protein
LGFRAIGLSFPPQILTPKNTRKFEERRDTSSNTLQKQFQNPAETLSVLLIIGGDIVQKAIAQLSGGSFTPVSFSFGWVAYAFGSVMSAFGDGTFMPEPDLSSKVITVGSRGSKFNESWVLGRLIRDLEIQIYRDLRREKELEKLDSGLIAIMYQTQPDVKEMTDVETDALKPPRFEPDTIWFSFFGVCLLQLVVAAIPIILNRNWEIIMATAAGTILALITGSLGQYTTEKYHCRRDSKGDYIITRGNGHNHVFLLLHKEVQNPKWVPTKLKTPENHDIPKYIGISLTLEDLANNITRANRRTRAFIVVLAILWIVLLITIGGLTEDTWYLFFVGAIGMGHNVAVAGVTRKAGADGIALSHKPVEEFGFHQAGEGRPKVTKTLEKLEWVYPDAGLALIPEFFQGGLRTEKKKDEEKTEAEIWQELKDTLPARKAPKEPIEGTTVAASADKKVKILQVEVAGPAVTQGESQEIK